MVKFLSDLLSPGYAVILRTISLTVWVVGSGVPGIVLRALVFVVQWWVKLDNAVVRFADRLDDKADILDGLKTPDECGNSEGVGGEEN